MAFDAVSDHQQFYIDGDNIVICFGLGEITPNASGMPEFTIPISMLLQSL